MDKVYQIVKKDEQYLLEEVDVSDLSFENEEDFIDWVIRRDYCTEPFLYKYMLTYQPEWGSMQKFPMVDEEQLRNEWEDDFVDELMADGVVIDDDGRYELYPIGNQPD